MLRIRHLPSDAMRERNARVRAHRTRVEQDMAKMGLEMGKALKICVACKVESVEDPSGLWRQGWRQLASDNPEDWLCPRCVLKHTFGPQVGQPREHHA